MIYPLRSSVVALAWGWTAAAQACPFCNSPTGQRVRQEIFQQEFAYHAAASLAPFPVLMAIVLLIHFGIPGRGSAAEKLGKEDSP